MSRRLAAGALVAVVLLGAGYWFLLRTKTADPHVFVPRPVATIGTGSEAIGVTAGGAMVRWVPLPAEPALPLLPLEGVPKGGRLRGPALEQVRVLGAAPAALQPYLAASRYGEKGVDVELTTGIDLYFGDSSRARKKWLAAAGVLADPSVTALDYVNLEAPNRPSFGGSEHELPGAP